MSIADVAVGVSPVGYIEDFYRLTQWLSSKVRPDIVSPDSPEGQALNAVIQANKALIDPQAELDALQQFRNIQWPGMPAGWSPFDPTTDTPSGNYDNAWLLDQMRKNPMPGLPGDLVPPALLEPPTTAVSTAGPSDTASLPRPPDVPPPVPQDPSAPWYWPFSMVPINLEGGIWDPVTGEISGGGVGPSSGDFPPPPAESGSEQFTPAAPLIPTWIGPTSPASTVPTTPRPIQGAPVSIWTDVGSWLSGSTGIDTVLGDIGSSLGLGGSAGPMPGGGGGSMSLPTTQQGANPKGYHWSAKRGKYVRNRHQNPLNVKALRRALRRAEGFIRIEKRVDKIVNRAARYSGRARSHGFVRGARARASRRGPTVIVEE